MSGNDTDTTSGDIFLDAQNSGQKAAYILNPRGALLWYKPAPAEGSPQVRDRPRAELPKDIPCSPYWQGGYQDPPGGGRGKDLILNEHYQTIHTVTAGNGYQKPGRR